MAEVLRAPTPAPAAAAQDDTTSRIGPPLLCGPLLRYTYTDYTKAPPVWHGSVLVVAVGNKDDVPTLRVTPDAASKNAPREDVQEVKGTPLLSEATHAGIEGLQHTFWRFPLAIAVAKHEQRVDYDVVLAGASSSCCSAMFWVAAEEESFRMMFHSCNGYSLAVKPDSNAGPVLWNDVLNTHEKYPYHVMIGGGDQVYSDAVRTEGPLRVWAANRMSPRKRAKVKASEGLRREIDTWYFKNYCSWYSGEPFRRAAASIPSVQIFDDHDIIDGYGSYKDHFMRAPIFIHIGAVAWKYYMLFQQHTPPDGEPPGTPEDPSWVIGLRPGPYIKQKSRSICTTFGKRIVFFGLDCRVERMLEQVCYPETYQLMFDRLDKAVTSETKHVLLLLGVPIAYPRMVWLETLFTTYTVTPIRWLNKAFGVAGGFFNKFDGSVELLDDLSDHWCAGTHKEERNKLVFDLQKFAQEKRVRITILSGDVHLAAIGRFYAREKLEIPQEQDYRYMVNIVSSAITNAPPPKVIANLLNRRDRVHHFDDDTDENLMPIFWERPDGKKRKGNRTTLPHRNYCIIAEHSGRVAAAAATTAQVEDGVSNGGAGHTHGNGATAAAVGTAPTSAQATKHEISQQKEPLGPAARQIGTHDCPSAEAPAAGTMREFALDVVIRAEIDPMDPNGKTRGYGFEIPALEMTP